MGLDVQLTDTMIALLPDQQDFAKAYEDREFVERIKDQLILLGKVDELTMLNLYLTGAEQKVAEVFGVKRNSRARNALSQRFRRGIDEAVKLLRPIG